jgi:hypothetical protein
VLVAGVVGHDVDDHPQPVGVRVLDEACRVVERAEQRVDRAVVGDVVAAVGHRGGVERGEPDRVDAEGGQVGQAGPDTGQVADAVAVAVRETADVHLVDDGIAPPLVGHTRMKVLASTFSKPRPLLGPGRLPNIHRRSDSTLFG